MAQFLPSDYIEKRRDVSRWNITDNGNGTITAFHQYNNETFTGTRAEFNQMVPRGFTSDLSESIILDVLQSELDHINSLGKPLEDDTIQLRVTDAEGMPVYSWSGIQYSAVPIIISNDDGIFISTGEALIPLAPSNKEERLLDEVTISAGYLSDEFELPIGPDTPSFYLKTSGVGLIMSKVSLELSMGGDLWYTYEQDLRLLSVMSSTIGEALSFIKSNSKWLLARVRVLETTAPVGLTVEVRV